MFVFVAIYVVLALMLIATAVLAAEPLVAPCHSRAGVLHQAPVRGPYLPTAQ